MVFRRHLLIMLLFVLLFGYTFSSEVTANAEEDIFIGEVLQVTEIQEGALRVQKITAVLNQDPYQERVVEFNHALIEGSAFHIPLRKGMLVRLSITIGDTGPTKIEFLDVVRQNHLINLGLIFFVLLLIFGRLKGFSAFISLAVTFLLIIYCLIPLIVAGYDPVLSSIFVSAIITMISFVLISGVTKKSLCAIIGTIGGTAAAGLLSFVYMNLVALTGLTDEYVQLLVTEGQFNINFQGLLLSGIIIGTLGAVMDVSMSITSVIFELKSKNYHSSFLSLFGSGLNVGRDIMATMTNTLILAYTGSALPLFLVFILMDLSFCDIMNLQYVSTEVVRSLCGSIGLILTVPITAFIAALKA